MSRYLHIVFCLLLMVSSSVLMGQKSSTYVINELSVSDKYHSDISPVAFQDGILFCSNRRFSSIIDRKSFKDKRIYNLFFASKKDSLRWNAPKRVQNERSQTFNIGPLCLSADGRTIYVTSEVEVGSVTSYRKYQNHSGIFIGEYSNGQINSLRPFKYNSDQYDVGHPTISRDGKYLFFASNMPGGYGGSDIWCCEWVNGDWSTPVNLGSAVNTSYTENYPFFSNSGKLYFSSDRTGGFGKLDVYYTSSSDDQWKTPTAMTEPINSSADDFAFFMEDDGTSGYFSSDRRSTDNIYSFASAIIRKESCDEMVENYYCYEFLEENAVKYDTIPYIYYWNFGDGTTASGNIVEHCYAGPGEYVITLDAMDLMGDSMIYNCKTYNLTIADAEQAYITSADTVRVNEPLLLNARETNLPGWDIDKYYWNFDDETIDVGLNVSKTWTQPGIYDIQLIVTAAPDEKNNLRETCVGKRIVVLER